MLKAIVLYPPPVDATTFERRYRDEHVPMVHEKIPGLRNFAAGRVVASPTGPAPYARVAQLTFDSLEDFQAAFGSAGGQTTVGHALEISTGGPITVLLVEDDG
jgi:uncharacterized protein (TIGR02118 family)